MDSRLYIVGTPIGNLDDITFRALQTLKAADLIVCEDTRVSKKLLDHYQIKKELLSYHQHSGEARIDRILSALRAGRQVAVLTDAGTPAIADPGGQLVAAVWRNLGRDCRIIPIPGPSALATALSVAGLPADRFVFFGFLPHKKGRLTMLKKIWLSEETAVFYESTYRLLKALEQLQTVAEAMPLGTPTRIITVCRELTKKFETVYRGSLAEIRQQIMADTAKGEFVVVVEGYKKV